ncbi:MAG: response regulator [Chloroflexi bacterium]|nr:response regulator [Chloroflexota bacterium]MBP8056538.1 response regulator [Chloroflexota bacterium]
MNKPLALIIEDEKDLSDIFAEALQHAEFVTEIVRDGQLAVNRLGEIVPDVVLLDLHLPNVAGTDILKQIRRDQRLVNTQVIVVTADARSAEFLRSDAELVLVKPVRFSQLRDLASRIRPKNPGHLV